MSNTKAFHKIDLILVKHDLEKIFDRRAGGRAAAGENLAEQENRS